MLHYLKLPFIPEIIQTALISWYYNNSLASHFGINKTRELIGRNYHWPSLQKNVETYMKGCNVCLLLKLIRHKLYTNLQALPVSTNQWKDLLINFVTSLLVSINWKNKTYNSILVIVDRRKKIVYYKLIKIIIDAFALAKVIFDIVVWHYGPCNSIVSYL